MSRDDIPAQHVIYLRSCSHTTADARQLATGELACETCGAKITAQMCPPKGTKAR